jgi:3-hydroxyisobutyrate dehydrogenase
MNDPELNATQDARASMGSLDEAGSDPTEDAVHPSTETPPPPRRRRPMGHVVGHAVGEPLPTPRGNQPLGHVLGRGTHASSAAPHTRTHRLKTSPKPQGDMMSDATGAAAASAVRPGQETARVGLLGAGLMGTAMARRLLYQGIAVIAWDLDPEHARALEASGGEPAQQPSEVVRGTGVVITMLPTADVVLDVVRPLLDDWPEGTIWLQMSSVGAGEADQLTQTAEAHGITLVDAPVSGSTHPAEQGQLTILASGPDTTRAAVEPIFAALASRVLWVGEAGMGSRLKLVANHWMITMTGVLAESMHLCQAMELDQEHFVSLLDGGPLGSAYGVQKLEEMRRHEYPAGFPVRLALKDLQLVREIERSSEANMPLLDAVLERFRTASKDVDFADQDLAAIYELSDRAEA